MFHQQLERNGAAHRVAGDMRFGDAEVVEESHEVIDHFDAVRRRIVRLSALPVPTAIERDGLMISRQIVHERAPHIGARGPAVNQHDRLTRSAN